MIYDAFYNFVLVIAAFFCSLLVVNWLLANAKRLKLLMPPKPHSVHIIPIPQGGGIGIVVSVTISGIILGYGWAYGYLIIALALIIALIGVVDDIYDLPAKLRLLLHGVIVSILIATIGRLPEFPLLFGVSFAGLVLSFILILIGIWWVNLFNFMDGIDGIAGGQAVFMLLAAGGLGAYFNLELMDRASWVLLVCLASATLGFLVFNWPPAKIFLGDAGSTYLAFMIFALALVSIRQGWLSYQCWLILGGAFISDASFTVVNRVIAGHSCLLPHNNHAFQKVTRFFGSHRPVTLMVMVLNLLWLLPLALTTFYYPGHWQVAIAYLPLIIAVSAMRAGKPSRDQRL